MDILYISHSSIFGGAERSLLDLIGALDRQRHAVRVVLPATGDFAEQLQSMGVPFDLCPLLRRLHRFSSPLAQGAQALHLIRGAMALRALTRRYLPTIIHANSTTAALYALALPLRRPPPTLWHLRDLILPRRLGRSLASRCAKVIVPSSCCRSLALEVADADKIVTIPNGIRVEAITPGRRKRSEDPVRVAVIGQLAAWKGHLMAVEVARRVISRCPNVAFHIIGDDRLGGRSDTIEKLRRMVDAFDLSGQVTVSGYVEDVRRILTQVDILLHPAFPEPFGRVVVEAMAAECPVVAFQGPHGPAEIIRHGVDGLLAEPYSGEALASAVVRLVNDPALRQRMGKAARRRAFVRFDRALMARRMQYLYASIAPGENPPGSLQRADCEC